MTTQTTDQTENQILERLVCNDIPETRELQELRFQSVGKSTSYEEHMKKYYAKAWEKSHTLFRIPNQDLMKVYSLAIPLTFPSSDHTPFDKVHSIKTDYFRWQGRSFGKGAMHLTTEKALNELISIFVKHNIPIKQEPAYGNIFDISREDEPGIVVPHSWYVDGYDPHQCLFEHQFVVCKQEVFGAPYYYLKEETIRKETEEPGYDKGNLTFSFERKTKREFDCRATFFNPNHQGQPPFYLPKHLEKLRKNNAERIKEWFQREKSNNFGIKKRSKEDSVLEDSSITLLKIGNPIKIFDPKWIEKS